MKPLKLSGEMRVISTDPQQQEIDRLREALESILDVPLRYTDHQKMAEKMHKIARAALGR